MDQIDLGETEIVAKSLKGRPNIAILLGAGFSVPKRYPISKEIKDKLLKFDYRKCNLDTADNLILLEDISPNDKLYKFNQIYFNIFKEIIKKYINNHKEFDYELFYDFINPQKNKDQDDFCNILNELKKYENVTIGRLLYIIPCIYNQLIINIVKDKNSKIWYDNDIVHLGSCDDYDSFLKVLSRWSNDYLVDVHTLNHDMLFESFNNRDYIEGKICDGFDEYGSRYYGNLRIGTNEYHCRLERYTGRYNKPIRLYKLHGSFDYVPFYDRKKCGGKSEYVKFKKDIGPEDIIKESKSKMEYENFSFTNHADFLTGKFFKIGRYEEPFYKRLFKKYKKNLHSAEKLIIIGYGGKDEKINNAILHYYDYKNKPVIIIDPDPSDNLVSFKNKLGAILIPESISGINENDLK